MNLFVRFHARGFLVIILTGSAQVAVKAVRLIILSRTGASSQTKHLAPLYNFT